MRRLISLVALAFLLGACSPPIFVTDGDPVDVTTEIPDQFELPARFAFVRTVYGTPHVMSAEEATLWRDVAERHQELGSLSPLVMHRGYGRLSHLAPVFSAARDQRYNYLLLLALDPASGSADITLYDVGSGGVMATTRAISEGGGRRGFWGGRIHSQSRLARVAEDISRASVPSMEALLEGVAERQ